MKGALSGMIIGILLMTFYMLKFKFGLFDGGFIIFITLSSFPQDPPTHIQELVEDIRIPRGASTATDH